MVVGDEPQLRARVPRSHVGGDEACKQKGVMAQPKYPGGMNGEGKVGLRVTEGVEQRLGSEGREGLFSLHSVLTGKRKTMLGVLTCLFSLRLHAASSLEASSSGLILIR